MITAPLKTAEIELPKVDTPNIPETSEPLVIV